MRADNADLRLSDKAIELNILKEKRKKLFLDYKENIDYNRSYLKSLSIESHKANLLEIKLSKDGKKRKLYELLGYENFNVSKLKNSLTVLSRIKKILI